MGYRSDVAYTIRFTDDHDTNNEQSFYTFLLEAKANPKCQIAIAEVEINHKKQEFTFVAISVKWYDNYPEVDSHMALVKQAEDWSCQVSEGKLHCKIGSMFVRIGEEANDIEERFNGDYDHEWMSVSRQIITDWS
tara:strand:+ start:172 stop:576 length:405 start_codon:yes stop_codon:yes gene_type:complete